MNRPEIDKSDWLLNFSKPTEEVMLQIKKIISQLPVISISVTPYTLIDEGIFVVSGAIDYCVNTLYNVLIKEFKENTVESEDDGWNFDFVVMMDATKQIGLRILVRIFSDTEPGNIFYGGTVNRVSEDQFRLTWDN